MTAYTDQAALLANQSYTERAYASVRTQALVFVNDARPEFTSVANAVMLNPIGGVSYNVVAMTTAQPAMSAESTDLDIDAAVQYVWPLVGAAMVSDTVQPSASARIIEPQ